MSGGVSNIYHIASNNRQVPICRVSNKCRVPNKCWVPTTIYRYIGLYLSVYFEIIGTTEVQSKIQNTNKNLHFTETALYVHCTIIFNNIEQHKETSLNVPHTSFLMLKIK